MDTFTYNLSDNVREEFLDGKKYLVAPLVLAVECVMNKLFYPASELMKCPGAWNGRPIPINHPTSSQGTGISANDPRILRDRSVGQVFNAKFEEATDKTPARLVGEAWLDDAKLNHMAKTDSGAKHIVDSLENNKMIEVSTGLFTDEKKEKGQFHGKDFRAIATNHRPDHLALLPGDKGACSIEDGCGFPRANKDEEPNAAQVLINSLKGIIEKFTGNELTHRDQRNALDTALRQKLQLKPGQFIHIVDIKSDSVIYEFSDTNVGKDVLYERRFTITGADDQVTLGDTDVMVKKRTDFVPQDEQTPDPASATARTAIGRNEETNKQGSDDMDIEAKVNAIIADEKSAFEDSDRASLMKMNEDQLDKISSASDEGEKTSESDSAKPKTNCDCGTSPCACKQAATNEDGEDKDAIKANTDKGDDEAVTKAELTDLVSNVIKDVLPAQIKENIDSLREADKSTPIIERLVANEQCKIKEEHLKLMSLNALEQLDETLNPGNYSGRGGPRTNTGDSDEVPAMPSLWDNDDDDKKSE